MVGKSYPIILSGFPFQAGNMVAVVVLITFFKQKMIHCALKVDVPFL